MKIIMWGKLFLFSHDTVLEVQVSDEILRIIQRDFHFLLLGHFEKY